MLVESGEFLLPPFFCETYTIMNQYYPAGPVNIHTQSLINILQHNNLVITTQKGQGQIIIISW